MFNRVELDPIARIDSEYGFSTKSSSKAERLGLRRFTKSLAHWGDGNLFEEVSKEETVPMLAHKTCTSADLLRLKKLYIDTEVFSKAKPIPVLGSSKKSVDNFSSHKPQKPKWSSACRRIIIVKNIVPNSGVNSVLSQVYGGPLERLVYKHNKKGPILELFFVYPQDAKRFFDSGDSGLLVVNGRKLKLQWAGRNNSDQIDKVHPSVSKNLLKEIELYGSRRCLIFSKTVPGKIVRSDKKLFYPNPKIHYSELDIERIKHDFAGFGDIVTIGPVISRKLCFSIHYADIRSAIMAKRDCESQGSEMNAKYHSWSIFYGTDPTDKPCPEV